MSRARILDFAIYITIGLALVGGVVLATILGLPIKRWVGFGFSALFACGFVLEQQWRLRKSALLWITLAGYIGLRTTLFLIVPDWFKEWNAPHWTALATAEMLAMDIFLMRAVRPGKT